MERMTRLALRGIAIAIAAAGVADPVITVSGARPTRATIVTAVLRDHEDDAGRTRQNLMAAAAKHVQFTERAAAGPLPCAIDEPCVVIADGSVDLSTPPDRTAPTSLIRIGVPTAPNVSVTAVSASSTQHVSAAGMLNVDATGVGVSGLRSEFIVRDGDAIVGSALIDWKADGSQRVAVPWWPIAEGPRLLKVSAAPITGEASTFDNAAAVGVTVSVDRVPVLVFEPRPSWASAFVRRALEADPRLTVESRVRLGPTLSSGTPSARLDQSALDRAALVVVGAPEALDGSEVALLERYVRVRGGTLVVLPDRAPTGPVLSLLRGTWREQLRSAPESVGPLRASELLVGDPATDIDTVLGGSKEAPALLLTPAGAGRILISGAMDAWRYRTEPLIKADTAGSAFNRFWTSIAVDASRLSAPLTIDVATTLAKPAERIPLVVRWRSMVAPTDVKVRAEVRCGGGPPEPIRLWPTGEFGVFTGSFPAGSASTCTIEASVADGPTVETGIVVADAPRRSVTATVADLERVVQLTGGMTVAAGDESKVANSLSSAKPPSPIRNPVRPMQSLWWMLVFASSLGGEWWLRRRAGLR
jgi:hypothetical protein